MAEVVVPNVSVRVRRKAAPFVGGELAAGEVGLDTTSGDLFTSVDGSAVVRHPSEAVVEHGADANAARPPVSRVTWIGSVQPANALPLDRWLNTA